MPFISVHMIVRERTNLGLRFINASLTTLAQANYPDEIVLVDNGSTPEIFGVYDKYKPKFPDFKLFTSDSKDFTSLRNKCLQETNPAADYFHWIDSDEVYYPEDLDVLKNNVIGDNTTFRQYWTYFYHFMIHPWQIQDKCSKDNIFRFTPKVHWQGGVHEHVFGLADAPPEQANTEYLHYGYIRQQWRTCLKWLQYDWIQHGHLGGYKIENCENPDKTITQKDWFRDWRNPNNILWDRNPICSPYPGPKGTKSYVPDVVNEILLAPVKGFDKPINIENWSEFLDALDPHEFWDEWKDQYKKYGNWRETLDWVSDRMVKTNWSL